MTRVRRRFVLLGVTAIVLTAVALMPGRRRTQFNRLIGPAAFDVRGRLVPTPSPAATSPDRPDTAVRHPVSDRASWLQPAIHRAAQIDDFDRRQEALVRACLRWADDDPEDALFLARQLAIDRGEGDVIAEIVQRWAQRDPAATLAWIRTNARDEERDPLLSRAVYAWAQTAPADAVRYAAEQMTPGVGRDQALLSALHQWALRDPALSTAWASSFVPEPLRARAAAELDAIARQRFGGGG